VNGRHDSAVRYGRILARPLVGSSDAVAAGNAAVQLDDPVRRFGAAFALVVGGEVPQVRGLPLAQVCPSRAISPIGHEAKVTTIFSAIFLPVARAVLA